MRFVLFQPLPTEKENKAVLYPYLIDIRLLGPDDSALLALVFSVEDNDLISHGITYHKVSSVDCLSLRVMTPFPTWRLGRMSGFCRTVNSACYQSLHCRGSAPPLVSPRLL